MSTQQLQTRRALQIKEVSKRYDDLHTLNNISIDVDDGEFLTIVGPSGCGKSTLLNIVAGLDKSYTGNILVNGQPVESTGPDRIVIFQEGALFPWLTVLENVEFGLRVARIPKDKRRETALRYIDMVQLSKFADAYIYQLSGGMKQRAAIARALALEPKILLMDEPFASLDALTRTKLYSQLQQIHQNTKKTILFITHDIREAACLGDRVIVLSYRPARIKKEFIVDLPRERRIDDPDLQIVARAILEELKEEVRLAARDRVRAEAYW